jgi:hypothetical protein
MNESRIKLLAVLIMNDGGATIGSGTLFVPRGNGLYAYIYTASHVIMEKDKQEKKLKFKMLVDDKEIEFETDNEDSIKCHDKYNKDAEVKEYDVAVIKVKREEWMMKLPTLTIGKPKENDIIHGQGFPINAYEKTLQFAMLPLNGYIGTCSDISKRSQLWVTNSLNPIEHDEDLIGYSGTGIYEECDDKSDLVLLGIFSYGQGDQAVQKITNIFYSELLRDICKKYDWEEPEDAKQLPRSFEPYVYDAIKIIENDTTRNQIKDLIDYFIQRGIGPSNIVDSKDTILDVPKCNNKNRTRCKECWTARLQLISILAILKVKMEDFKNPQIYINDQEVIPIDFFCSEGSQGLSQIRQVVRSIVDKEYAWSGKFRENAILVWASSGKQNTKVMERSQFNNVVRDICEDPVYRLKGYDALYGEAETNNLSIIHIDELMRAVDAEDLKSSINNLLEVLRNVIR